MSLSLIAQENLVFSQAGQFGIAADSFYASSAIEQ